ncbi:MAG: hypothetical protein ACFE9T_08515 [Promethearchaeota archaeon]
MNNTNLTTAYIKRIRDISDISINLSLLDIKNIDTCSFLLIVQSHFEKFAKLTIYPINKEKIIKLSLSGLNVSNEIFEVLSKILHKFQIIHTSGLLLKEKQLLYECYLNLNFSEKKSEDLKTSIDKIKNRFKEIKLEEISLKTIKNH